MRCIYDEMRDSGYSYFKMNLPAAETAGYPKNNTKFLSFPDLIGESRENTKNCIVRSSVLRIDGRTMTGRQT